MESICCLLHNLIAGGSARQWLHLLGRHVGEGGRATIVAPPGPLSEQVRAAGIEAIEVDWVEKPHEDAAVLRALGAHEVAIVDWNHRVMDAFDPALEVCGRAALVMHQLPYEMVRWLGPEIVASTRVPVERAAAGRHGVVLVRGEWHRRRVAVAFGIAEERLRILPPAIAVPPQPAPARAQEPFEILALTRLTPAKAPIVELAVELTRARLDAGEPCRLAVAGTGDWLEQAAGLCVSRLPTDAWRLEDPPESPIARLAASDLVVAQGQTTLEAAALERRVIVARPGLDGRAAGIVLTPARYDLVARDPFARLPVSLDPRRLLGEALAVDDRELSALRSLVGRRNSLAAGSSALADALARTA